jgi:hypothetical protein
MENLKKSVGLLCLIAKAADLSWQDKKIDMADFPHAMGLVMAIPQFSQVEWTLIDDEIKAAKAADYAALVEYFKASFDLVDDALEAKVEKILEMILKLAQVSLDFVALFSKKA